MTFHLYRDEGTFLGDVFKRLSLILVIRDGINEERRDTRREHFQEWSALASCKLEINTQISARKHTTLCLSDSSFVPASNTNMGRILPLSFSWPSAIDQHSFGSQVVMVNFGFTSSAGGRGSFFFFLYKPWQIDVLCQARVCVHLGPKLWLRSHVSSQSN